MNIGVGSFVTAEDREMEKTREDKPEGLERR